MRTQDEIVARIREKRSIFAFDAEVLLPHLDYDHAREFLKPETTREQWGAPREHGDVTETYPLNEETKVDDKQKERFRTGNYRHYKGGTYTALSLVTHHETRQLMVLYVSHATGTITVRPLKPVADDPDGWDDWVEHEGNRMRRFAYLGPSGGKTPEAPAEARQEIAR